MGIAIEKQLVAGMNIKYTLQLNHLPNHAIQCEVVIFTQEWTNTKKVVKDGCVFKRSVEKRSGGWSPADANDGHLAGILNEVALSRAGLSNEDVDIIMIEKQIVPPLGMNYKYTLLMKNAPATVSTPRF